MLLSVRCSLAHMASAGLARLGLRVFVCLSADMSTLSREQPRPTVTVRIAGREELNEAAADPTFDLPSVFVAGALAQGHRCVAASVDGRLAGYCWLSADSTDFLRDFWVTPPADAIYAYKAFTHPNFRGLRIMGACMAYAARVGFPESRQRVVTVVEAGNLRSLHAVLHWGFRRTGLVLLLSLPKLALRTARCRQEGFHFFLPGTVTADTKARRDLQQGEHPR